jgi:class 3 adenylate cyclase
MSRSFVIAALLIPLAGLVTLLAAPPLDVEWENHPAHFWLVLVAGALNAALAYSTGIAARRRGDARVFLVSLAFLAAAGFLGLHALATPQVLLDTPNAGFAAATPVGLLIAAGFAAWSSLDVGTSVMRHANALLGGLLALMALWAVMSLAKLPPFDGETAPERGSLLFIGLGLPALVLYGFAALRYVQMWAARHAPMLLAMAAAFALLAEAALAVGVARNWHATWWEWHLLMLAAFGLIAVSAHRQWHEERFSDLYLDETRSGTREISVIFADLAGFTSFSERHEAREVADMLNTYLEQVIPPIVRRHGGEIDNIIGDAVMVVFNRRGDQPDHAQRAARAALALLDGMEGVAAAHPGWPRVRVGVNTGEAVLSLLGTAGGRTHTAIGDAVNVASRLEGKAPVGTVVVGGETARRLEGAQTEPFGSVEVKGRAEPVDVHRLISMP